MFHQTSFYLFSTTLQNLCESVFCGSISVFGLKLAPFYSDPIDYLRMLAAFSLVMSFTGTTMFLVTGFPARWS